MLSPPSRAYRNVRFWMILIALSSMVGEAKAQEPSSGGSSAAPAFAPAAGDLSPVDAAGGLPTISATQGSSPIRRFVRRVFGDAEPTADGPVTAKFRRQLGCAPGPTVGRPSDAPVFVNGAGGDAGAAAAGLADAAGAAAAGETVGSQPVSSNPGAVDIIAGTGALGRMLGLSKDSGIRLGGLWIGDSSGILSGGAVPGGWGLNSLTIADLNFDTDKLFGWKGGSIGMEYLQFTGMPTNSLAGAFPGFDSIEAGPPLTRNELYELWFRQVLFDDKLIVRIGKSVPTYDFNNVVKPVPVSEPGAAIPAVSSLVYTPIFVNPTMLGVIPGYYNSASGITITVAPTKSFYLNYGFYDGNLANRVQTGLEGPHFNGYYFHIGEVGYAYRLGQQRKPGNIGVGVWGQTGKLKTFGNGIENGANGVYLFGSQRLWFRRPGLDNSGVSGFYQFGANNSDALLGRDYVGGGFTAFGLVPGRSDDSFGFGLAWTALNRGPHAGDPFFDQNAPLPDRLRTSQMMLQWYYQMKIVNGCFFQTALTEIPTPAQHTATNALALTLRVIVLF